MVGELLLRAFASPSLHCIVALMIVSTFKLFHVRVTLRSARLLTFKALLKLKINLVTCKEQPPMIETEPSQNACIQIANQDAYH